MRYIGNKVNILDKIYAILQANGVDGKSFFDLFSGTANVAKFFKHNGFQVYSCDVMYLSYCLQKAYIENNDTPQFSNLLPRLGLCGQNLFTEPLDLVLIDVDEHEAITIEGKKYCNKRKGIAELNNYGSFDDCYLKKYYPSYTIVRTVVLYGSENDSVYEVEVGFLLNENGKLVLGIKAPKLFTTAIANLLSYWN